MSLFQTVQDSSYENLLLLQIFGSIFFFFVKNVVSSTGSEQKKVEVQNCKENTFGTTQLSMSTYRDIEQNRISNKRRPPVQFSYLSALRQVVFVCCRQIKWALKTLYIIHAHIMFLFEESIYGNSAYLFTKVAPS